MSGPLPQTVGCQSEPAQSVGNFGVKLFEAGTTHLGGVFAEAGCFFAPIGKTVFKRYALTILVLLSAGIHQPPQRCGAYDGCSRYGQYIHPMFHLLEFARHLGPSYVMYPS